MRDPTRIPIVLEAVGALWAEHPDLRLGQLISVIASLTRNDPDSFYIEDEELVEGLQLVRVKLAGGGE